MRFSLNTSRQSLRKHLQLFFSLFFLLFRIKLSTFCLFFSNFFFLLFQRKRRIPRIVEEFDEEIVVSLRGCSCMLVLCCKKKRINCTNLQFLGNFQSRTWFVGCVRLRCESWLCHVLLTNFPNLQLKTLLVGENVAVRDLNQKFRMKTF